MTIMAENIIKAENILKLTDSDLQHYKLHLACYNASE
jgi:hypothetical protein